MSLPATLAAARPIDGGFAAWKKDSAPTVTLADSPAKKPSRLTVAATDTLSLGARYSHAVTDLFGYVDSDGSGYLDVSASLALGAGWSLSAHGGKQWIENNEAFEYADWKLGVNKAFDNGFSVAVAYTDTDADEALYTNAYGNPIAGSAVALTLSKGF